MIHVPWIILCLYRLEKVKEVELPSPICSASLHPDKSVFVCGGEDFKMYKYNYSNGTEIGMCDSHYFIFKSATIYIMYLCKCISCSICIPIILSFKIHLIPVLEIDCCCIYNVSVLINLSVWGWTFDFWIWCQKAIPPLACMVGIKLFKRCKRKPSKHSAFTQCCFNVGPASNMVCQHWNSFGWMPCFLGGSWECASPSKHHSAH